MPLLKGKKNIGKNITTEEKAGKPYKQALAIALNTSRATGKKPRYAKGGRIPNAEMTNEPGMPAKKPDNTRTPMNEYMGEKATYGNPPARKPDNMRLPKEEYMAGHFAEGGHVCMHCGGMNHYDEGGTVVKDPIPNLGPDQPGSELEKRHKEMQQGAGTTKNYASGGLVDKSEEDYENNKEGPATNIASNIDGKDEDVNAPDFDYSDSGEEGDEREKDSENHLDRIGKIMAKMSRRRS